MALKDLRRLAIDDMEKTSHPIIVLGITSVNPASIALLSR